jgi:acetylornithine deacetylase/succinyl-diaminopimelate desuccinylase-like protein
MTDFERISLMLTYCRPAKSPTEAKFIERFLRPLGVKRDKFGNHFLKIGGAPKVLWSSHTDSVHLGTMPGHRLRPPTSSWRQ